MSAESSTARTPPDLSGDARQTPPARRHKRTASLLCDNLEVQLRHVRNANSFDLSHALRSQQHFPEIFGNSAVDDRFFQQENADEKIQIIETMEPDFSVTSRLFAPTFFPLHNKLSAGGWEHSPYTPFLRDPAGQALAKDRFIKPGSPHEQLCSIPEQSELASSIFNSIHKHSHSEMQKMPSTHRFPADGDTSSRTSRPISSARIGSGVSPPVPADLHSQSVKLEPEGKGGVPENQASPKEAFRKTGPTDRAGESGDSKPRKIPRSDLAKKPSARPIKILPKVDGPAKKVVAPKSELKEGKPINLVDFFRGQTRAAHPTADTDRVDRSQAPADQLKGVPPKGPSDSRTRPRPPASEPKPPPSHLSPGSPPNEAAGAPKEAQGFFSTLPKKDWRHLKQRGDLFSHLVKTVKSEERPEAIQRLFKIRLETDKLIPKREPRREIGTSFKQKVKTMNVLPDGDRPARLLKAAFPGSLANPRSIRRTVACDHPLKGSFFHRLEKPPVPRLQRPNADRQSRSSCENPSFAQIQTPQNRPLKHDFFKKSTGGPEQQYRIKTESEVSRNRLVFSSAKRIPAKFLRQLHDETKTKNLNICFPKRKQSSDDSVAEPQESALKRVSPDAPIDQANPTELPGARSDSKRPASNLLGKARSLSLACLSHGGKSSHKNNICGNSIHVLLEKRMIGGRGTPRVDLRRLRIPASLEKARDEARGDGLRPSDWKDHVGRGFRKLLDDTSPRQGRPRKP